MCSSVSDEPTKEPFYSANDARVVLSEKGQTSGEVGHDADRFIAFSGVVFLAAAALAVGVMRPQVRCPVCSSSSGRQCPLP